MGPTDGLLYSSYPWYASYRWRLLPFPGRVVLYPPNATCTRIGYHRTPFPGRVVNHSVVSRYLSTSSTMSAARLR